VKTHLRSLLLVELDGHQRRSAFLSDAAVATMPEEVDTSRTAGGKSTRLVAAQRVCDYNKPQSINHSINHQFLERPKYLNTKRSTVDSVQTQNSRSAERQDMIQ